MGQLTSNLYSPLYSEAPPGAKDVLEGGEDVELDALLALLEAREQARHRRVEQRLDAAAQLESFERQTLKPGFHFIGPRVETTRFQALWVTTVFKLYSAPPRACPGW
jgi:hypothetical protein